MKGLAGLFLVGMVGLALTGFSGGALAATVCNTGPPGNPPLSGTVVGGVLVDAELFCVLDGANKTGGERHNDAAKIN